MGGDWWVDDFFGGVGRAVEGPRNQGFYLVHSCALVMALVISEVAQQLLQNNTQTSSQPQRHPGSINHHPQHHGPWGSLSKAGASPSSLRTLALLHIPVTYQGWEKGGGGAPLMVYNSQKTGLTENPVQYTTDPPHSGTRTGTTPTLHPF